MYFVFEYAMNFVYRYIFSFVMNSYLCMYVGCFVFTQFGMIHLGAQGFFCEFLNLAIFFYHNLKF